MQPRWPVPLRLFLLVPAFFLAFVDSATAQTSLEAAPGSLALDAEEPQIALPEISADSPFRNVSRSRRADSEDPLVQLCQEAVDVTSRRMLSTEQHTPWQMMHALLGLRHDFRLMHDGESVSGLDWVTQGQVFDNEYWFEKTQFGGRAHPYSRPYAFEGHANQFLAILSMCGVSLDQEFGTKDGPVTMREMIKHAQMTVNTKDEPTWTLWALSRYLPPSARWRNQDGEMWSIERLVQIQCSKPIQRGAPCGGTHAMFALAHARNVYQREGHPLRGAWMQAEYKIRQFTNMARVQQNSNGSLSSNFFRGRSYNPDYNKRMASVGHILEFLMIALPQRELNSRWVRRAIETTARDLLSNRQAYVKCSPLYHSVDALNIYLDRVNPRVTPTQDHIAEADVPPETQTAELPTASDVPRTAELKPVPGGPFTSISRSKDAAEDSTEDVTMDIASTDANPDPSADVQSPGRTPSVAAVGETENSLLMIDDQPKNAAVARDREKWHSTPADRQTPIVVADASSDEDVAVPLTETTSDLSLNPGDDLPLSADVPLDGDDPSPAVASEPEVETAAAPETEMTERPVTEAEGSSEGSSEASEESSEQLGIPVTSVSTSKVLGSVEEPGIAEPAITSDEYLAAGSNDVFRDPELNVQEWRATFESENRGIYRARQRIVDALNLSEGMDVADVGAGTGAFEGLMAETVGPTGRVFAVDLSPRFVEAMERRFETQGLYNVDVVRNEPTSLMLMRHKVDRILVCDSYNSFEQPEEMLASMFDALRGGGELVLVETERIPGTSSDAVLERVRAGRETFKREFTEAGFEYIGEVDVPDLGQNYLLRFRKSGSE